MPNQVMIVQFKSGFSCQSFLSCSCHLVKPHLMKPNTSAPRFSTWEADCFGNRGNENLPNGETNIQMWKKWKSKLAVYQKCVPLE